MSSPGSDEPFIWNVAGLLGEAPGAERTEQVDGATIDLGDDLHLAGPIDGQVHLVRTNRGILVGADLETSLALECSRCLREVVLPIELLTPGGVPAVPSTWRRVGRCRLMTARRCFG